MVEKFVGPLAIWPYPIINLLIFLFGRRGTGDAGTQMRKTSITEIKQTDTGWVILEHGV